MELKEICWDRTVREAVWKEGRMNPDYSPDVLRWDTDGRIMMWTKFGRTDSRFGWTIEAIEPLGECGLKNLDNLNPVSIYSPDKKITKNMESPSTGG